MNPPKLDLSIVIPAYNEESRLPKTLDLIFAYLNARPFRAEILVVDDGSSDRTAEIANAARQKYPALRLVSNGKNRGKGFSVREVIESARRVTGHPIPAELHPRRPGDPAVLVAGSEKAIRELGWKPRYVQLDDIVRTAWVWHQKRYRN